MAKIFFTSLQTKNFLYQHPSKGKASVETLRSYACCAIEHLGPRLFFQPHCFAEESNVDGRIFVSVEFLTCGKKFVAFFFLFWELLFKNNILTTSAFDCSAFFVRFHKFMAAGGCFGRSKLVHFGESHVSKAAQTIFQSLYGRFCIALDVIVSRWSPVTKARENPSIFWYPGLQIVKNEQNAAFRATTWIVKVSYEFHLPFPRRALPTCVRLSSCVCASQTSCVQRRLGNTFSAPRRICPDAVARTLLRTAQTYWWECLEEVLQAVVVVL